MMLLATVYVILEFVNLSINILCKSIVRTMTMILFHRNIRDLRQLKYGYASDVVYNQIMIGLRCVIHNCSFLVKVFISDRIKIIKFINV